MFKIVGKTNINFIGFRKITFMISGTLLIIGFVALVMVALERANLGIDFAGGTEITGVFERTVSTGDLREALTSEGLKGARIQNINIGDTIAFLIKVKSNIMVTNTETETSSPSDSAGMIGGRTQVEKISRKIISIVEKKFPGNKFTKLSSNITDPSIGRQLKNQAVWLVLAAIVGILLYIWIRFDFRFGVAATIATFHDVIVVLGLMFITGRELTILMVTALLTIAGYSLTDTVVVFDRIRENLKTFRRKGDFIATINLSINEVLGRTIMTSLTTLIVVAVLIVAGGEVVHDFAMTLFIGIIIGTYSSWFVASPIIVVWESRSPKRFK